MSDFVVVIINLLMLFLPCVMFGGVFLLIVVVFVVVLRLFIKQSSAISTKVTQDLSQSSAEFFAETVPQLISWETSALGDLSAVLDYSCRTRRGHIHARGKLKSLQQPNQAGWLVFEMRIDDFKGCILMKSSDSEWELQFLGLRSKETPVAVDGMPLGTIHETYQGILLLSVVDQQVGIYQQHQLLGGIGGLTNYAQHPYFGAVILNGRTIAEINRNPILLKSMIKTAAAPPLVKMHDVQISRDEQDWLAALVAWEILYRIVTK